MIKIYAGESDARRALNIWIVEEEGEERFLAEPVKLIFKRETPHNVQQEPTISLTHKLARPFLQEMADLCYKLGIKPTAEPILSNELSAVRYHLEDMRKLVFK